MTILASGRVVAAGPVAEVLAGSSSGDGARPRAGRRQSRPSILAAAGFTVTPPDVPDGRTLLVHDVPAPAEITRVLAGARAPTSRS